MIAWWTLTHSLMFFFVLTSKLLLLAINPSYILIGKVFVNNQLNKRMKDLEPKLPVQPPWLELEANDTFSWSPSLRNRYKRHAGGGEFGPSAKMKHAARAATQVAKIRSVA